MTPSAPAATGWSRKLRRFSPVPWNPKAPDMNVMAQQTLGIAIVEDDAVFCSIISALLTKETQFRVFEAPSGQALDQILSETTIDCILLDYNLGDDNGFAIRERIVGRCKSAPPFIMLTGDGRESTVIKALRMGIDDYLPKRDLTATTLISAITRTVTKYRDAEREKAEYLRLRQTSGIDPITGLHSRSQLENRLSRILSLPPRNRSSYALIAIEIVELKDVVERLGLNVADQVLRKFAERLREVARSTDTFGRYDDNIFVVIVETGADPRMLQNLHDRFLDRLSFRLDLDVTRLQISARIGHVRCNEVQRDGVVTSSDLVEAAMAKLSQEPATASEPVTAASAEPSSERAQDPSHDKSPGPPVRTSDRRNEARKRVLKRGQILVPSLGVIDCRVRNVSLTGAGLRLDAPFAPPPEFDLLITGDGTRRSVRVLWQIGADLGVEFID
jgi:diguanylate cyclase (GGDEF)-like protein